MVVSLNSHYVVWQPGPLLNEKLDVLCIPFKTRKELTFSLCGKFNLLFPASFSPVSSEMPKLCLYNFVNIM